MVSSFVYPVMELTRRFTAIAVLVVTLISLFAAPILAQDDFKPRYRPTLHITKLTGGPIHIDGVLDEPAWQQAACAEGFVENSPGDQTKPPVESRVLITYDENKLYLGFIAYDDPKTVRVSLRDRDNIFRDDYFGVMLDTYGDASWGYEIFVNPLGFQGDLRMLTNGNEDMSFDLVWESEGMVTDSGYQVEVAVPFSSLRFPDKPEQVWKMNFWRDRQRDVRRRFSWAAIDRDEACFMCQWGTVTGISGIRPGSRLEILPNIVASQAGQLRDYSNPRLGFEHGDLDAEFSLNARYGLSSQTSVEATFNPDFSQVESDATQIDVNSPFALFYEERRPFFQEGSDLFSTWITAIYTRSIADPEVATKLTGRAGHTSFAYLLGRDEHSPVIVPLAERSYFWRGGKSTSNIARVRHPLWDDSYIGGLVTDRRLEGGGSGTLFGGDASFRFLRNYRYDLQLLGSRTDEPIDSILSASAGTATFEKGKHTVAFDGEQFWGHGLFTGIVRDSRFWNASIAYVDLSPTFRADNGFETQNDRRNYEVWNALVFRPNGRFLQDWTPNFSFGTMWDSDGQQRQNWIHPSIEATFTGQTQVILEYSITDERYGGVWFENFHAAEVGVFGRPTEYLHFDFELSVGDGIARNIATPILGDDIQVYVGTWIKPTKHFVVEPQVTWQKLDRPNGGSNIFDVYVARTRFNYQFSRELFLRLVVEYVHSKEVTDTPGQYDEQATLTFEPLLSYKLNPFTVFYIGSTHDYWDENQAGHLYRSSQRFFAKFQYLFRI